MSNLIKNVFFHATMDCNNLNPTGKFFYGFADFDMDVDIKGQILAMIEHGQHFAGFDQCRVSNFQLTSFTPIPDPSLVAEMARQVELNRCRESVQQSYNIKMEAFNSIPVQSDGRTILSKQQIETLQAAIRKGPASVIGFERNGTAQTAFDMGWNAAKEQVWVQLQALGIELPIAESEEVEPEKDSLAYLESKITDEIPAGAVLLAHIDAKVEGGLQHQVACEMLTRLCWVINYGGNLDNLQNQVFAMISSMQDFGQRIRDDIKEVDES